MAHAAEEQYERKLRPIYDALDARSWKQAAKLAEGVLKKHKGDQLVRALKAYALHRSGKADEALQLLSDIVAEGPDSERIVMTMTYTFKAAGQLGGITEAYVAAAEKHPKDPEIMAGLFRAHVREFDFVRQQQAAMKLSKLAPAGSAEAAAYSWWVVTSLALQARAALLGQDPQGRPLAAASGSAAGGGLPPDKLLQLAESMAGRQAKAAEAAAATKQGQAGKAAAMAAVGWTYEALLLYLDILQGQGKAGQALQAVEGPLADAVPLPADRLQLRAAALVRAGDLPAAAASYRQALSAEPDDWLSWQLFLDCSLPGSGGGQAAGAAGARFPVGVVGGLADMWDQRQPAAAPLAGQEAAAAVAAVEEALAALQAEVAAKEAWSSAAQRGTLRAPHLWRCELLLRRLQLASAAGDAAQQAALRRQLGEAAADAFARLAGNFSCVADLRPYLAQLSGEEAEQLAAAAHRLAAEANAAEEASVGSGVGSGDGDAAESAGNGDSSPAAPGSGVASSGGSGASGEVRRLQRQVSALCLEAELGLPRLESAEEAAAYARRLLSLYRSHMHLSASLDEKERGYGEDLVVLAAGALVRGAAAAAAPGDAGQLMGPLLQAVLVLEAAQQRRKVSAPLRLAATALYSLLGAPSLASAQFAALDIKSILHDSLTGHWLLPLAAAAGGEDAAELRRWVEGTALLHDLHQQEAGESLATALQHGTYSKVPEFVDFKERLQHSHARALAAVLQALQPPAGDKAGGGSSSLTSLYRLGSPEARQAALHHACGLLLASSPAAAEGRAADGAAGAGPRLCFNEDLSTRPAWFPPGPAGGSAVAAWWEAAATSQPAGQQGYASRWWAVPQAAQGAKAEAAAWRSGCLAELRARLAWALVVSADLGSASGAAALAQQIQPLLVGSGSSSNASGAAAPAGGLQAAAAAAVLALLQAVGGDSVADVAQAEQLAEACTAGGQRLAAQLAAVQSLPVLPGSAVTQATAFASNYRAIAAICSKLKKLAGKAAPAAAAAAGASAAAATAAAGEVKQAAAAAAAALEEQQRVQAALALVGEGAASGSSGSVDEGGVLWAFEPAFEAQPMVAALVRAQLAALKSL